MYGCAPPDERFPDWRRDFGRAPSDPARLELEIGPGHGAFALDHAAAHPEVDLVAIETRRSDCELIRSRAARRALANLLVLQGDAKVLLPRLFAEGSLHAVHVHFPDPWWKTRHHKRRLVDVELAALLRTLLRARGEVDFRTDVPAYATEALRTWEQAGFENLEGTGVLSASVPEVLSTRERRYAQTGQPVFRARLVNPEVAPLAPAVDAISPPAPSPASSSPASPSSQPASRTGREWRDVRRK